MISKNKLYVLLSLFLFLFSCSTEEDTVLELNVSTTTLSFEAEENEQDITITSNTSWNIWSSDSWCKLSVKKSIGDASITISAEENETGEERYATITLAAEGVSSITISVTQAQNIVIPTIDLYTNYIKPDNTDMRNLTALEFSALMKLGWNIGNSLESINESNGSLSGGETSWGNPKVTQQLIDSVKTAGFNAVRLPVSWSNHFEDEDTYKISTNWMQRVEEVVNYALNNDMFVIMNIHWDGGWMDQPYEENQEEINNKLATLWTQIAVYFRDFDDRLLFAGSNEVHVENDWGTPSTENISVQNSYNQTFVNAVRATGGRNTYRHLVVQAYNTNIDYAVNYLSMPEDSVENKLFAEVHFYDPYDFTLQTDGSYKTQWGKNFSSDVSTWGQEDWVDEAFAKMKNNFTDKGIPVILGEYGATLRSALESGLEEHIQSRNYYLNYVTKAALNNGMIPFYWDNGYTGNNGMGLFDRSTGEQIHKDAIEAIISTLK